MKRLLFGGTALQIGLAYAALVALFMVPHFLGITTFPDGDFTQHFLPFSLFQQQALLAGQLPLWNPYTYSGHPFLADAQAAVFYPISNLLLLLTGFDGSLAGRLAWLQFEAALHVWLACFFTFLLVRRLTESRWAGVVAGLLFGFSGYLSGYPPLQLAILRTAVWLPLILVLLLPGRDGQHRWRYWLAAAAAHAIALFAGHPQTFLFLSYAVAGWMTLLAVISNGSGRLRQWLGCLLLYAGALPVLVAAQLLPGLEFTRLSVRAALSYDELSGGFPLADTWQFLLPGVLTHFSPLYIGLVGLVLALLSSALWLPFRGTPRGISPGQRSTALFFLACAVAGLLASFGENGPLYPLLYRFAPGWDLFRGQERAAFLVAFGLSVLGGYGLLVLDTLSTQQRRSVAASIAVIMAAGILLFSLQRQLPGTTDVDNQAFAFIAARSALLVIGFGILLSIRLNRSVATLLLTVLLLADLFAANFTTNQVPAGIVLAGLTRPELTATRQVVAGSLPNNAELLTDDSLQLRPRVYNEFRLPENSGMLAGWEDVWGSSPLRLSTYSALFSEFPLDRMWQLTGVGTVLTWRRELFVPSELLAEFPQTADSTYLHRLVNTAPRLRWIQQARRTDDETALALLADHGFDLWSELLVAEEDANALGAGWQGDTLTTEMGPTATLRVVEAGAGRLTVEIEADQAGLLFISENWMPGWRADWATEDDRLTLPVVRAHLAFLGILVPADRGILTLTYRPQSVRWGLAISAAGWLAVSLLFCGWFLGRFRRRFPRPTGAQRR